MFSGRVVLWKNVKPLQYFKLFLPLPNQTNFAHLRNICLPLRMHALANPVTQIPMISPMRAHFTTIMLRKEVFGVAGRWTVLNSWNVDLLLKC